MWIYKFLQTGGIAAASLVAIAAPLDKTKIAADARWIVHIDVDGLRGSALGAYLIKEVVDPMLDRAEQLKNANLSMNVSNITSVTAYGPAFEKGPEGVLVISTTADPKKDLDTVAGMFLVSAGTNAPFTMIEQDPFPLYSFAKNIYFAPARHALFVAKSREQITRAREVVLGKAENLAASRSFQDLREPPRSFFTVAVAEGFTGNAGIPVQAQVLKEAKGGRLSLGERDQNIFLNLVFQGKNEMATTRIQQVLQGLVALASLSQNDEEITRLAGGTRIASEAGNVMVSLEYPVDKTIDKIKESSNGKPRAHEKMKARNKHKKKTPPQEQKVEDAAEKNSEQPPAEIEEKKKSEG